MLRLNNRSGLLSLASLPLLAVFLVVAFTSLSSIDRYRLGEVVTHSGMAGEPVSRAQERFEEYAREVGLDAQSMPISLRQELSSGPRVGLDDCSIPWGHTH